MARSLPLKRALVLEVGSTMIEVMVAMFLFSVVGLAYTKSAIYGLKFQKRVEVGNVAKNLAVSKAEELSGIKIDLLTDSYDTTETSVAVGSHKITFKRVTNITVNSDGSRSIDITVSSTSPLLPKPVKISTRFAPWEA